MIVGYLMFSEENQIRILDMVTRITDMCFGAMIFMILIIAMKKSYSVLYFTSKIQWMTWLVEF